MTIAQRRLRCLWWIFMPIFLVIQIAPHALCAVGVVSPMNGLGLSVVGSLFLGWLSRQLETYYRYRLPNDVLDEIVAELSPEDAQVIRLSYERGRSSVSRNSRSRSTNAGSRW